MAIHESFGTVPRAHKCGHTYLNNSFPIPRDIRAIISPENETIRRRIFAERWPNFRRDRGGDRGTKITGNYVGLQLRSMPDIQQEQPCREFLIV